MELISHCSNWQRAKLPLFGGHPLGIRPENYHDLCSEHLDVWFAESPIELAGVKKVGAKIRPEEENRASERPS